MKCSRCGKKIANDSNFCEYCGKKQLSLKERCQHKKVMLYTALSFLCVTLLFIVCYAPGIETSYNVAIKLGDTWGFKLSRDIHFLVDWKIKSPIALAWLGLLISYPVTYFKMKGGINDLFNWGDDAPGAPGLLLIIAIVGIGLLIRTGYIAGNNTMGSGFWLMLCVLVLQLFVAFRLWKLTSSTEHHT